MAVNDSTSTNTFGYTSVATLAGAGTGFALGRYAVNPGIVDKNGITDKFVKSLVEESSEQLKSVPELKPIFKFEEAMKNVKSVDEYKKLLVDFSMEPFEKMSVEEIVENFKMNREILKNSGLSIPEKELSEIYNAKTVEEIRNIISKSIDNDIQGKSLSELKTLYTKSFSEQSNAMNKTIKEFLLQMWDADKKTFNIASIKGEEIMDIPVVKTILEGVEKTEKAFKNRATLIASLSGAALAGLLTFICTKVSDKKK